MDRESSEGSSYIAGSGSAYVRLTTDRAEINSDDSADSPVGSLKKSGVKVTKVEDAGM